MNELVHDLATEAGLYCDGTPDSFDSGAVERFAKLVIQKSAEYLKGCDCDFEAEQLEEFWNETNTN
jgi:Fe-S cluster assembly iron-binding protein IscA